MSMYPPTTRKSPLVLLVKGSDLSSSDIFRLSHVGKLQNPDNYIMTDRKIGEIIVNPDFPRSKEVKEKAKTIMNMPLDTRDTLKDRLFEEFESIVDDDYSFTVMVKSWLDWRKELERAASYKKALLISKQIRMKKNRKPLSQHWAVADELFNIVCGTYEKGKYDPQDAKEAIFLYGYMMGQQEFFAKSSKQKNKQLADFFYHLEDNSVIDYWHKLIFTFSAGKYGKMPDILLSMLKNI